MLWNSASTAQGSNKGSSQPARRRRWVGLAAGLLYPLTGVPGFLPLGPWGCRLFPVPPQAQSEQAKALERLSAEVAERDQVIGELTIANRGLKKLSGSLS